MEIRNTGFARVIAPLMIVSLVVFGHWSLCAEARADSYRCGRKLIRTGDSAAEVLRVCGAPGYKDRGQQTLRLGGTEKIANPGGLQDRLVIHDGAVERMLPLVDVFVKRVDLDAGVVTVAPPAGLPESRR